MEEQKSILVNKWTFLWGLKIFCTKKSSIQKQRWRPCVSDEQRNNNKTQFAWHVWGTDMNGELKWDDTLINTVLSERKMCEGEMKLITCNDEVRFKSNTLCIPTRSRELKKTCKVPMMIPKVKAVLRAAKIQYKTLLILTRIWRRSFRFRARAALKEKGTL
jgi:hypothetical protein